jgi:dihydroneopterin aldolase
MATTLTDSSITLRNLRFYAFHGVLSQERSVGGHYTVTLSVDVDVSRAMESDSVADTVNYAELYSIVRQQMAVPSALLEHVAGRIANAVFQQFPQITAASVEVVKDNPPIGGECGGAGVTIHLINNKTHV